MRNSLLVAPMPTGTSNPRVIQLFDCKRFDAASTSQILGNCECFEPFQVAPNSSELKFRFVFCARNLVASPTFSCAASWQEVPSVRDCLCPSRLTCHPEFAIVNPHLLRELVHRNMWSNEIKQSIIGANGSVQHLPLPDDIKAMYVLCNQRYALDCFLYFD